MATEGDRQGRPDRTEGTAPPMPSTQPVDTQAPASDQDGDLVLTIHVTRLPDGGRLDIEAPGTDATARVAAGPAALGMVARHVIQGALMDVALAG